MEMEVIPPGTSVNPEKTYEIMLKVWETADIVIPLHELRFFLGGDGLMRRSCRPA